MEGHGGNSLDNAIKTLFKEIKMKAIAAMTVSET